MRKLIPVLLLILLSGCSFQKPMLGTSYGPPPTNIDASLKTHYEIQLIDADSAKFKYGKPYRAYENKRLARGGKVVWHGWAIDVMINSKNRFGGYTGYKAYTVKFLLDTNIVLGEVYNPNAETFTRLR